MQNPHNIYTKLISQISKFFTDTGFKKVVLGVSGGIDSALVLKLLVDALKPENVTGLIMPEYGVTQDENTSHARVLCDFLGVENYTIPINRYLQDLTLLPWKPSNLAQMNTKARIRTVILYNYANTNHSLVVGTSNKSELLLGYGTKFGDLACDLMPIGDLYKTDVYALAEHLSLPQEIIEKAPTAELFKGQTDETDLGLSYAEIDRLLREFEKDGTHNQDEIHAQDSAHNQTENLSDTSELNASALNPSAKTPLFDTDSAAPLSLTAKTLLDRIKKNEHKGKMPYVIKI